MYPNSEPMMRRSRDARAERPGAASERRSGDDEIGALDLLELTPAIVRMGALASLRAAGWATSSTVAAWRRVGGAARAGGSPSEALASAQREALRVARRALGVTDIEETLGRIVSTVGSDGSSPAPLRERGRELLARSAELAPEDDGHPAYGLVLEQLAPDEARILRVLATQGPEPAVDVEASGPLGIGGRAIAQRLSMIGERAGCRHPEQLSLYLDNLLRLGLVQFRDEPLEEEEPYYALEAQPAVDEAREQASGGVSRPKIPRRRLELTDFGQRFCEACLPLEDSAG
jgi:hypothetical protein